MPFNNLYNFAEATRELRLRLGNRSDLGTGTQNRVVQWLNSAQIRIAGCMIEAPDIDVYAWPWQTVPDQSEYSLLEIIPAPTNIVGIKVIRNNGLADDPNSSALMKCRRFPWTEYRSLSQQAPGPPQRWARWGYIVALDPKPDDVYNMLIDYRRLPEKDTTEVPVIFQEDWLHLAESFGWDALMKHDRAMAAFGRISANLQLLLSQELDQNQWESCFDTDQVVAPFGFDFPYSVGS